MFYSQIKKLAREVPRSGSTEPDIAIPEWLFRELLRSAVKTIPVDEAWYVTEYEDIAKAVKSGLVESPRQHYHSTGYFENRFPYKVPVDESYYLKANEDVAKAVGDRRMKSGYEHWERHGIWEGRPPSHAFSLFRG